MVTDVRPHPRPRPERRPPVAPIRRPGEQSAGRVLLTMVVALALAALVNADAIVDRVEREPFGHARDRSLAIWHPVQDVAHVTQLTRLRDLGDWLAGNEDRGASSAVPPVAGPSDGSDTTAATVPELRTPTAAHPLRVYLAGDSIMHDAGNAFLDVASGNPLLAPTLHYENATGLTRPDFFDWPSAVAADAERLHPDAVFLLFGGNDAQGLVTPDGSVVQDLSDPAWQAEYRRRVGAVMDELQADGRRVYWIGLPPMRSPRFDAHAAIMSTVYREAAASRPWVTYLDIVPLFGDERGHYVDRKPDASGTEVSVRKDDGVHFNAAGADRIARHLLGLIDEELAATAPATTTTGAPGG
jgi:uncharacterized protein